MRIAMRDTRLTRLLKRDEGIGLILVIGISAMMAILLAVITATAIRSLQSSSDHVNFEQSLAAAESGVDTELSKVQAARNQVPSVNYESPVSCRPAAPSSSVFASEATEKAWARTALEASTCIQTNAQGQFVSFKVPGRQIVYSMGWSPSRTAANASSRILKVEYIFAPYRPGKALLTGGNIDFSGSVAVNAVSGLPADVHTNANVTGMGSSLSVSGGVTAVGTVNACPGSVVGGCKTSQAPERVPVANPRAVYSDFAMSTAQWYDLCADGTVRSPVSAVPPAPDPLPCTGTQLSTSPYRSWYWTAGDATTPGTWTLQNTGTSYPGTYYVYGANAQVGANGNTNTVQTVSVIAESTMPSGYVNASTCNKFGGNIDWKLFDIQNSLGGVIFIAQGSLSGAANSTAQAGLIMAGDKIDLQTSSATVKGALIANNTCAAAGSNNIQGMTITYDQSVTAPVFSVVNTTLWLEYTG